ncbi:hypothetical protein OAB20_03505 [Winogradskyella sp.]|nr:hypothetical protein [Winogradskyella sp.]
MKNILLLSLMLCIGFFSQSQNINDSALNNYKYVVLPLSYNFLKGENVYRLNTLTKFLFKQNGFDAYFDKEELPEDLFTNRCLALYADVEEVRGGFRKTKLQVTFKDCYGKLVFTSDEGTSNQNKHKEAHHEALRNAFKTFEIKTYSYQPKSSDTKKQASNAIKGTEIVAQQKEKTIEKVTKTETIDTKEVLSLKTAVKIYTAVEIINGYQLINANLETVMVLLKTSANNIYLVKDKNAIVFKEDGKWIYSENLEISITKRPILINF